MNQCLAASSPTSNSTAPQTASMGAQVARVVVYDAWRAALKAAWHPPQQACVSELPDPVGEGDLLLRLGDDVELVLALHVAHSHPDAGGQADHCRPRRS